MCCFGCIMLYFYVYFYKKLLLFTGPPSDDRRFWCSIYNIIIHYIITRESFSLGDVYGVLDFWLLRIACNICLFSHKIAIYVVCLKIVKG